VVPRAAGPDFEHYVTEERIGDYPDGRYERNLQIAVETGDQEEINALLSRRSRSQVVRLGVSLLVLMIALSVGMALLNPAHPVRPAPTTTKTRPALDLPPVNECPPLRDPERTQLTERLNALGKQQQVDLPEGSSDEALAAVLAALDKHLGTPDPRRDPGPLREFGPLQRQLRALLWKHGVADYSVRGLNTVELLERLQQRLNHK
jgi:hypothetical protein